MRRELPDALHEEIGTRPIFPPRCVLFDLDGTLVDTAPDLGHAANLVRGEAGLPPLPIERYRPVASAGARGLLKVGLDLTPGHADFPARRESFLKHYRANLSRESRLFDGIDAVLRHYEQRGVKWGVVTNKPQWLTDPLMHDLGLAARAACVIGQVDGLPVKPSPEPLLKGARAAGVGAPECVYVGDDLRDIVAARAARMRVIAAAWGYLGDGEAIETWQADAIYATPGELAQLCP